MGRAKSKAGGLDLRGLDAPARGRVAVKAGGGRGVGWRLWSHLEPFHLSCLPGKLPSGMRQFGQLVVCFGGRFDASGQGFLPLFRFLITEIELVSSGTILFSKSCHVRVNELNNPGSRP